MELRDSMEWSVKNKEVSSLDSMFEDPMSNWARLCWQVLKLRELSESLKKYPRISKPRVFRHADHNRFDKLAEDNQFGEVKPCHQLLRIVGSNISVNVSNSKPRFFFWLFVRGCIVPSMWVFTRRKLMGYLKFWIQRTRQWDEVVLDRFPEESLQWVNMGGRSG